ncbi:MAG: radical SAM protein [Candidatus Nanoarchaeia archaeon]|nr:radical SAM protein [Candidatus Nanoarchaeia archaeon]MDD5358106.1 radical SAM protein [Candidatus Nanoarchaeia archaeon]MDD5589293.1 radical SAM protein [Candidatus Nanoarchaeia archaeon]
MKKDIIEDKNLPVIIFGAGIVGEALFNVCNEVGVKVESFCDNNKNKTKLNKCGTKVFTPAEIKEEYGDANFLISAADIKDVVDQLEELGFSKWYAGSLLLKDFNVDKYKFNALGDFVRYAVDTCILCQDNYLNPNKLFLRSVDLIITERCSLKCKNCSNLMQYYEKPKDCDYRELKKSIDSFCNIADEINEFRILGGEPFMNKDFDLTIKRLINEPKVKKVVIYTNGTIVPEENKIDSLKDDKVLLLITDYNNLSRKLENLTEKLSKKDISFYVQKAQGWTNCSDIFKHYRNIEEQKKIFQNCCARNTFTLSNGKLYRCPFSANADRLRAVPNLERDYINIFKEKNVQEMKEEIKEFIMKKDFLETCDYCNGRSFGDTEIEPAIQIKKSLEYKKYE